MDLNVLTAVSPIDGRYRAVTRSLGEYFSEYALMRERVRVEIEYFILLASIPLPQLEGVDKSVFSTLRSLYLNFSLSDAERIKEIEKETNHDVKAVEYFLKERFDAITGMSEYKEFVHFGLTSQDINNTALPLMVGGALSKELFPRIEKLIETLKGYAAQWADIPLLAHTHGQPASPTRLGKEFMVFAYRLEKQYEALRELPLTAKFGGATGNFNAHHAAFPQIEWRTVADKFIESLGLRREQYTTQISNYDSLAAVFDALRRINTIILDLDRDVWMYVSMDYFKQTIKEGEVGSSAMPHKVNPIDFENSEGNLGVANALLTFLAQKLPVSRLQRDLTDSTVVRNIGVPFAHTLLAIESTLKGLGKLILNREAVESDINDHWAVVAEGIQTILRRENYPHPYEALKALTRKNEKVTPEVLRAFINTLDVSESVKEELLALTPSTYTGI